MAPGTRLHGVLRRIRRHGLLLIPFIAGACATRGTVVPLPDVARQVEVRRTTYGVPQILAQNLRAAGFALAYVQIEDYGTGIIEGMQSARGRAALVSGARSIDADARNLLRRRHAVAMFDSLQQDTRDIYDGFAQGMNHFIRAHRSELPEWMQPDFSAIDVFSRDIAWPAEGAMNTFRQRLARNPADPALLVATADGRWQRSGNAGAAPGESETGEQPEQQPDNVGSNAWALAPSRTTSGRAIMLRNPHLAWTSGYYEAHVRVPGKLDFYGDFRIGGPFSVIGGFNRDLGFSTTNNENRTHEYYAFRTDASRADHIIVDGQSVALRRDTVTVTYRDSTGTMAQAAREFLSTPFGPVITQRDSLVYVYRPALNGEYRAGEQWLEMMKARSLAEYQRAMRMQARETSNFTYADRAGNIYYTWVSTAPALPHPDGGDTLAIYATRASHVWSRLVPFDSLPHLLNPPGGYIHNENDSPHYTNLNAIMRHDFPFWVQEPSLRLRSQHALEILHNDRRFSLEDVVAAKHSMRMLLADRVKNDLIAAVRATAPTGEVAQALELLATWDNTAAADARGALLFETWWNRYRALTRGAEPHRVAWDPAQPASTPHGLSNLTAAAQAFTEAVPDAARRFGSWSAAWGDVHRVRRGNVDVPVGGCSGALGCFRVLNFSESDGKRIANGGDGWVLAVEFGDEPRAYTVLAYGQSPDPASPFHANQAALFAANRMKPVLWSEQEIAGATVHRYHPGEAWR
jgi:acyl-homoserine-lactone acylase